MPHTILVVDDEPAVQELISRVLRERGYSVERAHNGAKALAILERTPIDLVVLDLHLPDQDGLSVLGTLRSTIEDPPPVIMVSGQGTIEHAVEALRRGALTFLQKPLQPSQLLSNVEVALKYVELAAKHAEVQQELGERSLLGDSEAMQRLRLLIRKAAPSEGRVLITGQHGTGKELVAAAIHAGSSRRDHPFVKLNCAAIPLDLIESELFGHDKGAFTGANKAKRGKFELADEGTLFLDEIGEMSPEMQAKTLRALQEGELERVGGTSTLRVDVRVIAATNRDIEAMCRTGAFREDLYYRINVVRIHTPALEERRDDIPLLAERFLRVSAQRNNRKPVELTQGAIRALQEHDYPGNVRELQNLVERLVILADDDVIDGRLVKSVLPTALTMPKPAGDVYRRGRTYRELIDEADRQIIQSALASHGYNMAVTARALGLARSHLYKKCDALGLRTTGTSEPS